MDEVLQFVKVDFNYYYNYFRLLILKLKSNMLKIYFLLWIKIKTEQLTSMNLKLYLKKSLNDYSFFE